MNERDKIPQDQQFGVANPIFERNPLPMFIIDRESLHFVDANGRATELYGYTRDQFRKMSLPEIHPPEDVPALLQRLSGAKGAASDRANFWSVRHRKKNGTPIDVEVHSFRLASEPPLQLATVIDITQRKRAEAALRESEERFRLMADGAPVLIWMADTSGECTFFNQPWLDFTGRTLEQELGHGWSEGIHPDDFARGMGSYERAIEEEQPFKIDYRLRRFDGEYRWVEDHGVPRRDSNGAFTGFIGSCIDVTDRRRAEDALRRSDDRFRQLAENIEGVLWLSDPGLSEIEYINSAYEKVFGLSRESLYSDPRSWLEIVHPEDRERIEAGILSRDQGATEDFRIVLPDGSIRWIRNEVFPALNESSEVQSIAGIALDVTADRRVEERIRSALSEKELLLKEIHHRVKNNLQIISSLLRLQARASDSPEVQRTFAESQSRIHAMALLHESLYRRGDLARIDFPDYVTEVSRHLLMSFGAGSAGLDIEVAGDHVMDLDTAVPGALIVNELLSNAFKHAFPEGASGKVHLKVVDDMENGETVITVSDAGAGVNQKRLDPGQGSIGLQLVQLLVRQIAGSVEWGDGPGTTVTVRIPRKRQNPERFSNA